MARKIAETPELTEVVRIGSGYYPVLLLPEVGPHAYEYIKDGDGAPISYSRRYSAVQFLWRRERDDAMIDAGLA